MRMHLRPVSLCAALLIVGASCTPAEQGISPPPQTPTPAPTPTPEPTPLPDPFERAEAYTSPDVTTLIQRLRRAEEAIRSPLTGDEDLPEHGRIQQAAYRQLARTPDWVPAVLDAVPRRLVRSVEANVQAQAELLDLTRPAEDLPDHWRIVEPPPPRDLRAFYAEAEERYNVGWTYLAAINLVETRMGRIQGDSTAGAQGPMQFMPGTWEAYGEGGDVNDPRDAIMAAARYLAANGAPDDMDRALFAYNRSQRYVRAITLYAQEMAADERTHLGYHHWQVYYRTERGDALLEPGWGS